MLSLRKSRSISGMLLAEGEEPFLFPTVEGKEAKHELDQLPQLCEEMSQSQVLPSHIQPQHCLSGPQQKSSHMTIFVLWPKWNQLYNNSPQDSNLVHSPIIWEITPALQLWGSGRKRFLSSKGPIFYTIPWWCLKNQGRGQCLSFQSNSCASKHIWKNTF